MGTAQPTDFNRFLACARNDIFVYDTRLRGHRFTIDGDCHVAKAPRNDNFNRSLACARNDEGVAVPATAKRDRFGANHKGSCRRLKSGL